MISQTTTHATLLARLAGDQNGEAWREFIIRYGDLIRGFAVRRGLQPADCDDVVQEVMARLTRSLPGFEYDRAKGRFRGYLKTTVLHCVVDLSCQKRGVRSVDEMSKLTRQASGSTEVEDDWELEWRRYHLRLAMRIVEAEFKARDIAAFRAYSVEGQDVQAVAASLSMSSDQVYQAKSRILKRVCEVIEQQVADEG